MAVDLYKPFLVATRNVFQLMFDLSDITDRPVNLVRYEDEVAVSIGVVGDLAGQVIYRFPQGTSLNMVKIMSGMEVDAVDDFVTSAISEIANIISGNVLTILAGENVVCDLLPPVLYTAEAAGEYAIRTACCITTSAGEVCLDIRLNPAK